MNDVPSEHRVVPFGNPRIKGHLHLPAAYRSLSRPSSPPRAKASAMRPCLLLGLHSLTTGIYFQLLQLLLCLFQHVIDRFPFYRKSENSGLEPNCQPIFQLLFLYIFIKQFRRYKRLLRAVPFEPFFRKSLQKGGVPAAPSGTATLLRLSPNHQFYPRPPLAVTDFRHPRLSWLDGRCVQGPGTYSPRHG